MLKIYRTASVGAISLSGMCTYLNAKEKPYHSPALKTLGFYVLKWVGATKKSFSVYLKSMAVASLSSPGCASIIRLSETRLVDQSARS
jgi:hypothetical protein